MLSNFILADGAAHTFFEQPILKRELGNNLFQIATFPAQLCYFIIIGST